MQVPLAWHWETFKELYKADNDGSCSASCHHLRAVQAVAKEKVEAQQASYSLQRDECLLVQHCGYLCCVIGVIRTACDAWPCLVCRMQQLVRNCTALGCSSFL